MINLSKRNAVTSQDFDELFKLYARAFLAWKTKTTYRVNQDLSTAFRAWWLMRGPSDFKTSDDSSQFQAELFGVIERLIAETPAPVAEGASE